MKAQEENAAHCWKHAKSHPQSEQCPDCCEGEIARIINQAKETVAPIVQRERENERVPQEVVDTRLDSADTRRIAYNLTPPTPLKIRRACLSCNILMPGFSALIIDTLEGLMEHRRLHPDHFLVKESKRDLMQLPSGWWTENDE